MSTQENKQSERENKYKGHFQIKIFPSLVDCSHKDKNLPKLIYLLFEVSRCILV